MDPFGDDEPDWATDDPFGDGENGDDEANDGSGSGTRYGAEHLLFLFDCDHSMFERYVPCLAEGAGDDSERKEELVSPMDVAVEAAHRFLRTKIRDIAETRGGKRDGVGVLLYGCDPNRALRKKGRDSPKSTSSGEDSEGMEELPATHELLELTPPGIEHVLCLQECRPHDENAGGKRKWRDLGKEFARLKEEKDIVEEEGAVCTLDQGLKAAQKMFEDAKCVKSPGPSSKDPPDSKSVWIFTNRDDPFHGGDDQRTHQRTKMMNTVKADCREHNIAVHVMPLPKKDSAKFDRDLFFNEFTSLANRVEDEDVTFAPSDGSDGGGKGALDVEAIVSNFQMSLRKKRKYATVPLLLPGWKERDSPGIMLDLFGMVQVRSKPAKVSVHQEKNRMTNRVTKRVNKETNEVVEKEDLHHFAELCGRVSVQPATIAKMKRVSNSMEDAGLVLHGFRPMRLLPTTNLMSRSAMAISNDARVRGSGKALYNLKQSMVKKKVFAVGELLTRASATSRMVAMVPKNDETDGFLIVSLPYKEDVRAVAQSDIGYADRSSVDSAKEMISKSTLSFEDFAGSLPENPWLKHFFGYLESVSLGRPLGEVEDDAKMDADMLRKTAGEEITNFSMSLPEDDVPVKKERKRKAPGAAATSKPEFAKEKISEDWIDLYKSDEIADCTATELKAFLKGQGERVAGKKQDLVDRAIRVLAKEVYKQG